jgi:hypothetical protein
VGSPKVFDAKHKYTSLVRIQARVGQYRFPVWGGHHGAVVDGDVGEPAETGAGAGGLGGALTVWPSVCRRPAGRGRGHRAGGENTRATSINPQMCRADTPPRWGPVENERGGRD